MPHRPGRVADIDWRSWKPVDRATLLFVVRDDRILLIRKKRGLGAGKITGPGGRLEAGESARQAAVRELQEELCITPVRIDWHGDLRFHFLDGYSIHVEAFRAHDFRGTPRETAEAVPLWFDLPAIPYDQAWADNILWLPLLLQGEHFSGRFIFDGDALLDHSIRPLPQDPRSQTR